MQQRVGVLIAAGAMVAGAVTAAPASAARPATAPPEPGTPATAPPEPGTPATAPPAWKACATTSYPRLQCAELSVPLDHDDPLGERITLALSRVPHTAKTFQGPLLVNPGGPGAGGRTMAGFIAASLPSKTAAQYDIVGFDPRGVGASKPALNCKPGYFTPVRPDSVPRDTRDERVNLARAASFARACGEKYGRLLPHISTTAAARDLDAIRQALGARQISYLGYSYGTYLGAVYARLFPDRVRRAVLDSVVDPRGVWYEANLAQDTAFDARHKAFAAWVARHDRAYKLGTDPAEVERRWYAMREALKRRPAGHTVGPAELEDTFLPGGYYNGYWPMLAEAFSAYANERDPAPLVAAYKALATRDASDENGYSIYAAVQCRDARWPKDWGTWYQDNWRTHAKAPFSTWNNAWYNAPCAFWPVEAASRIEVTNDALPPILLFQATEDAATPFEGAVTARRELRGSRLVVEEGGGNHGVTLAGNACMDGHLARYLDTGELPKDGGGQGQPDAVCAAGAEPEPVGTAARGSRAGAAAATVPATGGAALHGLLGHRG
ncbi:alpha/beta hydrolase [Streptomyces sp. NPDC046887]|uniref:alpha/beta hydrolase n=1 Tax=Streptomyces sp. NPDC046887 TaxID=3155472 RepID=UPI0033E20509